MSSTACYNYISDNVDFISLIESIKALFQVQYASVESRLRPKEEEAYIFFVDFLDECEGEIIIEWVYI